MKLMAIIASLTAAGALMAGALGNCLFKPVDGPGMERDEADYVPDVLSVKYWYMNGAAYKAEHLDEGKTIRMSRGSVDNESFTLRLENTPDPFFYDVEESETASSLPGKKVMPIVTNKMTHLLFLDDEYATTGVMAPILEGVTLEDMITFELASIVEGKFKDDNGNPAHISEGDFQLPGEDSSQLEFGNVDGLPVNVIVSNGKSWMFTVTAEGILVLKEARRGGTDGAYYPVSGGKVIRLTRLNGSAGRWPITGMDYVQHSFLKYFDSSALSYIRNEILARHGYTFSEPDLQSYFESQDWYHTDEDIDNDHIHLTEIEVSNISIIKYAEKLR